jgi:hypothetical protein
MDFQYKYNRFWSIMIHLPVDLSTFIHHKPYPHFWKWTSYGPVDPLWLS